MLYFDLDLRLLVTRPGYASPLTSLKFKRGDLQTLELQYCRGTTLVELAGADPVIRWGIKETLSGALLALADTWTKAGGIYSAPFSTNTEELLANLGTMASKKYLGELTFTDDNGGPTSSQTIPVTVENDVLKEDDAEPVTLQWLNTRAVRFDVEQNLTESQGAQAAENIGVPKFHAVAEHPQYAPEVLGSGSTAPTTPNASFPRVTATHYGTVSGSPGYYWVTGGESYWAFRDSNVGTVRWRSPDVGAAVAVPSPPSPDLVALWTAANGSTGALAVARVPMVKTGDIAEVEDGPLYRKTEDGWIELVSVIDPTTNVTDDAGLARVAGKLAAVYRHQTNGTWHTLTIVDSGIAAGGGANNIPATSISDPL